MRKFVASSYFASSSENHKTSMNSPSKDITKGIHHGIGLFLMSKDQRATNQNTVIQENKSLRSLSVEPFTSPPIKRGITTKAGQPSLFQKQGLPAIDKDKPSNISKAAVEDFSRRMVLGLQGHQQITLAPDHAEDELKLESLMMADRRTNKKQPTLNIIETDEFKNLLKESEYIQMSQSGNLAQPSLPLT